MKDLEIKKLYYSISEVSKMTTVKPYVLRYWESEFPELHPSKNRAGNRNYRSKEVKLINLIKKLLYEEKYTIEGAKQKVKKIFKGGNGQIDLSLNEKERRQLVDGLKEDLKEIMTLLS